MSVPLPCSDRRRRDRARPARLLSALCGLIAVLALLAPATAAAAARGVDARLPATVIMRGRITSALRVRGERASERITRSWSFSASGCGRVWCRTLRLTRQRGDRRLARVILHRTSPGTYTGASRFFVGLSCLGRVHPFGLLVPYRITLRILHAVTIQGVRLADRVTARYSNPYRVDRTVCPLGPSHDSAVYSGTPAPGPPNPAFTASVDPRTDTAAFVDRSTRGGDGARIVRWAWNFGDAAAGAANTSSGSEATHTFSAPGTYTVTLTVTDGDGLTASHAAQVVAPGSPNASFAAAPTGAPLTVQFTDSSTPGAGGAAITAWSWNFGDPNSGPADASPARDPQHTFTAPGTYTVCLTVTDANGRQGGHCAPVGVTG